MASSEKHSKIKAFRRQQLGFRPLHFAAVGLPLGDTATNGAGSSKTGAFRIDDGGVVGMSWYLDQQQFHQKFKFNQVIFFYSSKLFLSFNQARVN